MTTNITGLTITSDKIKIDYSEGEVLPFAYYYNTKPSSDNTPDIISTGYTIKKATSDDILTNKDIIYFDTDSKQHTSLTTGLTTELEIEWYYPMQFTTLGYLISNNIKVVDIFEAESIPELVSSNDQDIINIYSDNDALNDKVYIFYTTFGRFTAPKYFSDYNLIISPIKTVETKTGPFIYINTNKNSIQNPNLKNYYFSKIFVYNTDITTNDDLYSKLKDIVSDADTLSLFKSCIDDDNVLLSNDTSNSKINDDPSDYLLIYIDSETDSDTDSETNKIYYIILDTISTGFNDTFTHLKNTFDSQVKEYIPEIISEEGKYYDYHTYYLIGISPPTYYKPDYFNIQRRLDFEVASSLNDMITTPDTYTYTWNNTYIAIATLYHNTHMITPIKLFSYNIAPANVFMFFGENSIYETVTALSSNMFLNCASKDQIKKLKVYDLNIAPNELLLNNVYPEQSMTNSHIFSINGNNLSNILYNTEVFTTEFLTSTPINNSKWLPKYLIEDKFTLEELFFKPTTAHPSYPLDQTASYYKDKSLNALALYGVNTISLKKDTSAAQLPQLTCDNPYGNMDDENETKPYPIAMFTPFIDTGSYPPILSNGNGVLWKDQHKFTSTSCNLTGTYNNYLLDNQTKKPQNFGFMEPNMNSDSEIKGNRFITMGFFTTSLTTTSIRPCLASTDFPNAASWMYDTLADYYAGYEKNSLDIWITSIREADGDVILSYGGYNGTMSADRLLANNKDIEPFSNDTTFITQIANKIKLQKIDWKWDTDDLVLLSSYGIGKIGDWHKTDNNYSWGYTGEGKDINNEQYENNLYACYYLSAKYYKVRWIDFDIEAASQNFSNWKSHIIRIYALKKLMMTNKYINVRYTFATNPVGLVYAYPILWLTMFSFKNCDIQVRKRLYINLMTMDYGDTAMIEAGFGTEDNKDTKYWKKVFELEYTTNEEYYKQLAEASVLAVCNTAMQMSAISQKLYDNDYTWLSDTTDDPSWVDGYFSRIGNTPMIGLNDSNFSAFTNKAAELMSGPKFVDFAKTIKVKKDSTTWNPDSLTDNLWTDGDMKENRPPPYDVYIKDPDSSKSLYQYMIEKFPNSFGSSGHISMWSLNRDINCTSQQVELNCTSGHTDTTQFQDKALEFSEIFQSGIADIISENSQSST